MKTKKEEAFQLLSQTYKSLSNGIDQLLDRYPYNNKVLSVQINDLMPSQIMSLYNVIKLGIISMKNKIEKGDLELDLVDDAIQDLANIVKSFEITEEKHISEVTKKKDELVLIDYLYRIVPKDFSAEEADKLPWVSMKPVCEKLNLSPQRAINSIMEASEERIIVEFRPVYSTQGAEISTQNPNRKG